MNKFILIGSGIILLGFFILLFLVFKARKKHKAIKHYEELRDKLSVRELEKETGITEDEYNNYNGSSVGSIIRGFIVLLVGVSLMKPIQEQLGIAVTNGELTGVSQQLVNLVPIFFAGTILIIVLGIVVNGFGGLKSSGLV